jgi:hypothetical protein
VNLGVSSPALFRAFTGRDFPKNPASILWPMNVRIGSLMPDRCDMWWSVDDQTELESLGAEVSTAITGHAVPFLERFRTAHDFNTAILNNELVPGLTTAQATLVRATLASQLGAINQARTLLNAALNQYRGKPFEATVRLVAKELALELRSDTDI